MMNYLNILKQNRYVLLCLGQLISQFGNWFYVTSTYFLVYQYTGKATALGLTLITIYVPKIFSYYIAGKISDRYHTRSVMIFSDSFRFIALLPLFFVQSKDTVFLIYLVNILLSVAASIFQTARTKSIKLLFLSDPIYLRKALALMSTVTNIVVVVGSLAGGIYFWFFGFKAVIIFNMISFVFSVAMVLLLRIPEIEQERPSNVSIKEESVYTSAHVESSSGLALKAIGLQIWVLTFFFCFAFAPFNMLCTITSTDIYKFGALGTGILLSALGIGMLIGAFIAGAKFISQVKFDKQLLFCMAFFVVAMCTFFLDRISIIFAIITFSLISMSFQIFSIISVNWILHHVVAKECGSKIAHLQTVSMIGYAMSFWINGYMIERTHDTLWTIILSTIVSLMGLILTLTNVFFNKRNVVDIKYENIKIIEA